MLYEREAFALRLRRGDPTSVDISASATGSLALPVYLD